MTLEVISHQCLSEADALERLSSSTCSADLQPTAALGHHCSQRERGEGQMGVFQCGGGSSKWEGVCVVCSNSSAADSMAD